MAINKNRVINIMSINEVKASFSNSSGNQEDVLSTLQSLSQEFRDKGVNLEVRADSLFEREVDITISPLDGHNLSTGELLNAHNEIEKRLEHLTQ